MIDAQEQSRPPLVLIANDHEWSARSLESILAPEGYAVLRAYTGSQALERAKFANPDVIILDAQMPDTSGVEVCRALRQFPGVGVSTPILITTAGPSGRVQRLDAYRAGAWEFYGQPVDGEALLLKLASFVAAKTATDRLRRETILDAATGLYNARGLALRAREIGSEAARRRQPLAGVVLGAAEGEGDDPAIAEQIAELFRRQGRAADVIGRLAPLEFGVLAPATGATGAVRMVNRLNAALQTQDKADRSIRLRAGYCAVPDFNDFGADALELLIRAGSAFRSASPSEEVRAYN